MELKLKIHLAYRVELRNEYNLDKTTYHLVPACGKQVKLLTQDVDLVDCSACLRRIDRAAS